jgi:tungstate transport system substrate-binding protein
MKINNFFSLLILATLSTTLYAQELLRMSTTTSTENSGLLTILNRPFERQHNVRLDVIAVGTGKALKLGENGDVDVVFVHAPQAEMEFVDKGYGVDRAAVMHNDFVLVGPNADPANIKNSNSAVQALSKIAMAKSDFISRGDDSGTHKKELQLWLESGIKPIGSWYIATGQGMGAVLKIADEKQAYTLTDRGTFIAFQDKVDLIVLVEGDSALFNPYHIMAVNKAKHPHVQYDLAKKYIEYVISEQGQNIISNYQKAGQQLFYPVAYPAAK